MIVDPPVVNCGVCGLRLEGARVPAETGLACPACGTMSHTIQATEYVSTSSTITVKEKVCVRRFPADGGKWVLEQIQGDDLHRDTGTWRQLSRVIDRENNEYHEIVTDPETGEILHECKERLSEHHGHGAAKLRRGGPKEGKP